MDILEPQVAGRLDDLGVPPAVAASLATLGVGIHLVERMTAEGVSWDFVAALMRMRALQDPADVAALVSLTHDGLTEDEISGWARLGRLDPAYRLHLKGVPVSTVQAFPSGGKSVLADFLKMLQAATARGMHPDDLLWWHTAGVVSLTPPYVDEDLWATWRSVGVHHLGLRPAALAAAAGLSVHEAVEQWHAGAFSEDAMRMMAALRAGVI